MTGPLNIFVLSRFVQLDDLTYDTFIVFDRFCDSSLPNLHQCTVIEWTLRS